MVSCTVRPAGRTFAQVLHGAEVAPKAIGARAGFMFAKQAGKACAAATGAPRWRIAAQARVAANSTSGLHSARTLGSQQYTAIYALLRQQNCIKTL